MHVIARAVRPVAIPSILRVPLVPRDCHVGLCPPRNDVFFDTFGVGGRPNKKTAAFAAVFSQQNGKKQMAPGHMRLQSMHRHRLVQGFILRSKPWKFPA